MLWVLEIIFEVASNIVYDIMKRLLQQFLQIGRSIIDPQDKVLLDTVKDLPPKYKVTVLSSDVEAVNRALSRRPIAPENFADLRTPLQRLLAACALMVMAQLDESVRKELERIDQRLCELSDQLARQLNKIEDSLRKIYEETTIWFDNVDQGLDDIQKEIRGIRDDIHRLQKVADSELRQELEALDANLRRLSQDIKKQFRDTDAQIADINRTVAEIGKSIKLVRREISALRKQEIKQGGRGLGLRVAALATVIGLVVSYSLFRQDDKLQSYPLVPGRELPSRLGLRWLSAPGDKERVADE